LKYFTNGKLDLGPRLISNDVKDIFYKPYLRELEEIKNKVQIIDPNIDPYGISKKVYNWKTPLSYLKKKVLGMYNVHNIKDFLSS
jgi:hypothetical protein